MHANLMDTTMTNINGVVNIEYLSSTYYLAIASIGSLPCTVNDRSPIMAQFYKTFDVIACLSFPSNHLT